MRTLFYTTMAAVIILLMWTMFELSARAHDRVLEQQGERVTGIVV